MGLLFVGCGAVLGIGGLYVLAPVVVGLAGWMIYKVSVAVYSLRKPLQSECIPLYPDIDKDYTPAVREHLKRRYAGKV
jgi:hypothetical protein